MAPAQGAAKKDGAQGSTWLGLLQKAGEALIPVVVTAGSLIGFVAFAGSVIVWTRFAAVKVPPDQAVAVFPRGELVAIGSSLLLLFGFFGALAVLTVYLIDRGGRATPGMSRGLLLLLMVEGVAAIVFLTDDDLESRLIAAELFLLPIGVALWATFVGAFTGLEEGLPDREGDEREVQVDDEAFRRADGSTPIGWVAVAVVFALAAAVGAIVALTALLLSDAAGQTALLIGLTAFGLVLLVVVLIRVFVFYREKNEKLKKARVANEGSDMLPRRPGSGAAKKDEEDPKPRRLQLKKPWGVGVMAAMMVLAGVLPSVVLLRWWLAAALASAMVLTAGLWRVSNLAEARFMWYGLAVFISVPLFGTLTAMAHNLDDPQVQPMALIRSGDGPDEAIQGIYVTEADDRIYFATLQTEGCSADVVPSSGRLFWVPKDEVVAISLGPLQGVDEAARRALEMSYALTPAVEGSGTALVATPPLRPQPHPDGEKESRDGPPPDHRLESVGAAVQPYFGTGLSLDPLDASPGDEVTLRMSSPRSFGDENGFGPRRDGRSLRLGGVPASVVKEPATSADEAEFLATREGPLLALDKLGGYLDEGDREEPDFVATPVTEAESRQLYVKLVDPDVVAVDGEPFDPEEGTYLPLSRNRDSGKVEWSTVTMRSGARLSVRPEMQRQAWREDEIRFVVPEGAASGAVTVECKQLAGQPLLQVTQAPQARIGVRIKAGTRRVVFDAGGSTDPNGRIESRRWTIEGLPRGGREQLRLDLPPRRLPYPVRLTVTDSEGQTDVTTIEVLRLPPALFAPGSVDPEERIVDLAQRALERVARQRAPASIEISGYADRSGAAAANLRLSMRRAENLRLELLGKGMAAPGGDWIPVTTVGYGEACPIGGRGASNLDRRVDVFVLGEGASVTPSDDCHAGRVRSSRWSPAVSKP